MKTKFFYLFLIFILSLATSCQSTGPRRRLFKGFSFKPRPASSSTAKNNPYSAGFIVMGGQGSMGNSLVDAENRDMNHMPVQIFFGFRFSKFRFALNAEYSKVSQSTDPLDVSNTNIAGTGLAVGPRLDYYDGIQSFGVFYRASDSYRLDRPDINNEQHEYKSTNGIGIQYTRRLAGRLGVAIDYTKETFTESLDTQNIKWDRISIGLIYSNFDKQQGRWGGWR